MVTLFLWPEVNLKLRPKLLRDLKPGTRVVSYYWDMGDWVSEKQIEVDGQAIYLWTIPPRPVDARSRVTSVCGRDVVPGAFFEVRAMCDEAPRAIVSRREVLETTGKAAVASVVLPPLLDARLGVDGALVAQAAPLDSIAGVDRITVLPGRTYLNGWTGYGSPPRRGAGRGAPAAPAPEPPGPPPTATWSKESGPGEVTFADSKAGVTTATFSAPGAYVLKLTADNGQVDGVVDAPGQRRDWRRQPRTSTSSTPRTTRSAARSGRAGRRR